MSKGAVRHNWVVVHSLSSKPWTGLVVLVAALALLNASLTFQSLWPTPAIEWQHALSVELAVVLIGLALAHGRARVPSASVLNWIAAVWVLLVLGRYEYVTAPALFGRELNLYFDLRFIPDVTAMLTRAAPLWLVATVAI